LQRSTCTIAMRIVFTLAFAALPTRAVAQTQPSADRGCPPPPIREIAASRDSVPALVGETAEVPLIAPTDGWEMGRISWVAVDGSGLIYLFQRGDKADPIVVVNREGRVVRSWGKGLFNVPHSLRIDPQGHVWTTDANTSLVRKFSSEGRLLLTIDVGDVAAACDWPTRGATDVAFTANGHIYVADGYTNARIVEYSSDGRKVREWGSRGSAPGDFVLPHSILADETGTVYVADRENGRIQRFDVTGKWLGEWFVGGKPFTLERAPGGLWVDVLAWDAANRPRPTLLRISTDGTIIGRMIAPGGHGTAAVPGGTVLIPSGSKLYRFSPRS
jgi:DNA-binding beta-propeller fold protein YncE